MPLPLPNLDDRRWADLVEEGRALIPLYSPRWTDHNVHDPGITLLELFAWIAEMDVYRLNRVSDRHRRKFMQLIGVEPRPPEPAATPIAFVLQDGVAYLRLPRTLEVEGRDPAGVRTRFRLTEPITVVPAALEAIVQQDADGVHDLTPRWRLGEDLQVLGPDPRQGCALLLGFDRPLPADQEATLYFIAAEGAQAVTPASDWAHHSVRTVWEFLSPDGRWRTLDPDRAEVVDETRAFSRSGHLRFALPATMGRARIGQTRTGLCYLRCRLSAGQYDEAAAARALIMNAVIAEQAVPVGDVSLAVQEAPRGETERLGAGTGRPNQLFIVSGSPLLARGLRLFTIEGDGWHEWTSRPDLDASAPADRHAGVNLTTGVVTFGDGQHGRVVPEGALIVAMAASTRAADGNLAARTVDRVASSTHNEWLLPGLTEEVARLRSVTNPVAASGGAPAESVAEAQARALDELARPRRAVTLGDYEFLARETPGVRLARVSARARLHPGLPCVKAPGLITVVVLPFLPLGRPMPSRGLLNAVATHLAPLRTIGTRVEVVGPSYVELSVRAVVRACAGASAAALQARVAAGLDRFFDPLHGGPAGTGWPFGRDVYRSEVLQVIDRTPGIDHVVSLDLVADGGPPRCGNVCVGALGLVAAVQHDIQVVEGRDVS